MKRIYFKFKQFGGIELVKEYARKGVLLYAVCHFLLVFCRIKTLKQADSALRRKIAPKLREEFHPIMMNIKEKYANAQLKQNRSNIVWFCWLQGLDNAPEIVKVCYNSLKRNLHNKDIIVLTNENINDYVTFPEYIMKKYHDGIIDKTKMSNLIRLELLIKYGGSWIDATVFCSSSDYPVEMLDNDLFVFQLVRKNYSGFIGLSNWFITACTNNRILLILRDMHYEYWMRYNCIVDYFFFHLFFNMIAGEFQEEIAKIPKYNNRWPLLLGSRLADDYDKAWMEKLCQRTCFHKLTYHLKNYENRPGTFYDVLLSVKDINIR